MGEDASGTILGEANIKWKVRMRRRLVEEVPADHTALLWSSTRRFDIASTAVSCVPQPVGEPSDSTNPRLSSQTAPACVQPR